jgi:SAM-dependent methyltransferase
MDIELSQRGRASIDFLVSLGGSVGPSEAQLSQDIKNAGVTSADDLPDDPQERLDFMASVLANSHALHMRDLVFEWSAVQHGLIARQAFEDIRPAIEPRLRALAEGPTTISAFPHFTPPDYFDGVWFHRTHGGWDGHEHQGFIHAEMIQKPWLTALFGAFDTRRAVLDNLPGRDYRRIFEMGVSSGFHTLALADAFPEAEISGCDLSRAMLEHAQRQANERGLKWQLYLGPGEDTRLPGGSFDLVSSFIVLHELPAEVNVAFFAEAFRLLEPGGAVIMTDVPPYRAHDKLTAWRYDRSARYGGEPYWREAGLVDTAEIARDCGFMNVRAFREPTGGNFWVTIGEKPAAAGA